MWNAPSIEYFNFFSFYHIKARAEKEIRDLGAVKEKLEAEWELVKFMGQVSHWFLDDIAGFKQAFRL